MRRMDILPVLDVAQMRQMDAYSIETVGIPGETLMGRAAEGLFTELAQRFPARTTYIGIFCGHGNNGGDGLALAELLWLHGWRNFKLLTVATETGKPFSANADYYRQRLQAQAIEPEEITSPSQMPHDSFAVKVDALFGTGLDRELSPFWQDIIRRLNELAGFTLAVDCPSGLNADSGHSEGAAVKADLTVTMGYPKRGFFTSEASELVGELAVHDIGLAPLADAGVQPVSFYFPPEFFRAHPIPERRAGVHKGDFGKLVVIAGSRGFSGAAKMVGRAALRSGAGLVRMFIPEEIYEVIAAEETEVMVNSYSPHQFEKHPEGWQKLKPHLQWADVLALGSGLSERPEMQETADRVLRETSLPFIADAEGTLAALRWLKAQEGTHGRLVLLTPHLGELAKLAEKPLAEVMEDPREVALNLAREHNCYILAKSAVSFLATPSGHVLYPPTGSPVLAKGGSGDVLVGALAARIAIALRAAEADTSPYQGGYLTSDYYSLYPPELAEDNLPWLEGIMRGYALFADASRFAADFYESDESVLAGEVADMIDADADADDTTD